MRFTKVSRPIFFDSRKAVFVHYEQTSKKDLNALRKELLTRLDNGEIEVGPCIQDIDSWIQTRKMEKEMKRVQRKDKLGREIRGLKGETR